MTDAGMSKMIRNSFVSGVNNAFFFFAIIPPTIHSNKCLTLFILENNVEFSQILIFKTLSAF